jgi:hypothetical protein
MHYAPANIPTVFADYRVRSATAIVTDHLTTIFTYFPTRSHQWHKRPLFRHLFCNLLAAMGKPATANISFAHSTINSLRLTKVKIFLSDGTELIWAEIGLNVCRMQAHEILTTF